MLFGNGKEDYVDVSPYKYCLTTCYCVVVGGLLSVLVTGA